MAPPSPPIKLPPTQKAIIQAFPPAPTGSLLLRPDRPLPDLHPAQVLIQTAAVALNPCDWKMPTNFPCPGAVDGSDFAGTIVALGADVGRIAPHLQISQRVAGAVHASNPLDRRSGAFAEYVAADADLLWTVPDWMASSQAAAIGWCVVGTVGMAIFRALKLPGSPERPMQKPMFALVHGGSTASGTMAIQMLKLWV